MSRRAIWNLPVEALTLAELYAEKDDLERFQEIARGMTKSSGWNKFRDQSMSNAALRAIRVDTFIDITLGRGVFEELDSDE